MMQPHGAVALSEAPGFEIEVLPRTHTMRFARGLAMPVQVQATLHISDLERPSGARCVLEGAVVLAGLSAVLRFERGSGGRRRGERFSASEVALIPAGDWFALTGSRFEAPMTAGSPLQLQFRDLASAPLSETLSLSPLGGRRLALCASFCVPAAVVGEVVTVDPSPGSGSRTTVAGKLVFPRGVLARLTFRPAEGSGAERHVMVGSADAVALPGGREIRFAGQLKPGPAAGRALQSVSFVDGYGFRFAATGASVLKGLKSAWSSTG